MESRLILVVSLAFSAWLSKGSKHERIGCRLDDCGYRFGVVLQPAKTLDTLNETPQGRAIDNWALEGDLHAILTPLNRVRSKRKGSALGGVWREMACMPQVCTNQTMNVIYSTIVSLLPNL